MGSILVLFGFADCPDLAARSFSRTSARKLKCVCSGVRVATSLAMAGGTCIWTIPAPARAAARPASTGAPTYFSDPPTTPTLPNRPLKPSSSRCGSIRQTSSILRNFVPDSFGAWSRSPISTGSIAPQVLGPSAMRHPILTAPKATVTLASTVLSSASPVSQLRPEGTSMATMSGSSFAWSTASRVPSIGPVIARECPVPSKESMMTSADLTACAKSCAPSPVGSEIVTQPALWHSVSRSGWRVGSGRATVTDAPRCARIRAAISPSPPFLPGPASTTTCMPTTWLSIRSATVSATARPGAPH